jgi:hypothetical protein
MVSALWGPQTVLPGHECLKISHRRSANCVIIGYDHSHRNCIFFPLWLYSPILGLDCLHEMFCFISVTRSRTVGRTPSTGDQLVARLLLTARSDCDCDDDDDGEVGGMNGFDRGNSEKTCPNATLSTINPTCQTQASVVWSQRLTASAMAQP